MKIDYTLYNGKKTEIEVSDEVGSFIISSYKEEHAQDERKRYHCYSLDAIQYEGSEYAAKEAQEDLPSEVSEKVRIAFSHLTEVQKRRILMYSKGYSMRKIAEIENANVKSIEESIKGARKKFLKFF